MRIAVVAISKNEEQFVQRWYDSAAQADVLLIADTGSTDQTVELARSLGITVANITVSPWRFDDARNACLALVPADVDWVITLDMDEVLQPGWREAVEAAPDHATRLRYPYTWNWNADGTPGLQYGGDKIHRRQGYRWKHPVHEVAVKYDGPEVQAWIDLQIHHHADDSKSRSQYLPLLELAVAEDPLGDRNLFYLGREYMFNGLHDKAIPMFMRYLEVATWLPERSAAYRWLAKANPDNALRWLQLAVTESDRREAWVDLAKHHYQNENWPACLQAAQEALRITEKPLDYLCEAFAWGSAAHDYAAISAYHIGLFEQAVQFGEQAVEKDPGNERLHRNVELYKEKLDGNIRATSR
jgi:glycosyltransferase involved in cell wall biosynthesis